MVMVMFWAFSAQAYTINDSPSDAIGAAIYESYGINVYNFTTGTNSGSIIVDLFTNFPQAGETVNGSPPWTTRPADLFITETYKGAQYQWAVPLVNHDGYVSGNMYAVGTFLTSDDMDPSHGTGYIYNHGVPVSIATTGNNYGFTDMGSAGAPFKTATWTALTGLPDYVVRLNLGIFEDDLNGSFSFLWGTATCANDVITGQVPQVPIPPSALLLGSGLFGLILLKKGPWLQRRQTA
jgi:hypothetical protein